MAGDWRTSLLYHAPLVVSFLRSHSLLAFFSHPRALVVCLLVSLSACQVEGEANALKFGQVFLLMPTAPNSQNFYVHNDVFRLNYG